MAGASMFSIPDLSVIDAEHLAFGQFAYVESEMSIAFVGKISNGDPVAVFLDNWSKPNLAYPHVIPGAAITVEGACFEVELESARRISSSDGMPGELVWSGKKLALLARGEKNRPHSIYVGEFEGDTSGYVMAFSNWRIVRQMGDKSQKLFEMKTKN